MINLNTVVSHRKDIDTTDLNGDKVMMDLEKGRYFSLNSVGSRIWELIEEPIEINKVVGTLLTEYEIDQNTCEESVLDFVKENVDDTVTDEDIELCEDMFESYTVELDHKLKPFEDENKKSMMALIMYSMNENRDSEMETFLPKYILKVNDYSKNQKRNYKIMQYILIVMWRKWKKKSCQ